MLGYLLKLVECLSHADHNFHIVKKSLTAFWWIFSPNSVECPAMHTSLYSTPLDISPPSTPLHIIGQDLVYCRNSPKVYSLVRIKPHLIFNLVRILLPHKSKYLSTATTWAVVFIIPRLHILICAARSMSDNSDKNRPVETLHTLVIKVHDLTLVALWPQAVNDKTINYLRSAAARENEAHNNYNPPFSFLFCFPP